MEMLVLTRELGGLTELAVPVDTVPEVQEDWVVQEELVELVPAARVLPETAWEALEEEVQVQEELELEDLVVEIRMDRAAQAAVWVVAEAEIPMDPMETSDRLTEE